MYDVNPVYNNNNLNVHQIIIHFFKNFLSEINYQSLNISNL